MRTHSEFVSEEMVAQALGDSRRSSGHSVLLSSAATSPAFTPSPTPLPGRSLMEDSSGSSRSHVGPEVHAKNLAVLTRYGRWRVSQASPPDEPPGILIDSSKELVPVSPASTQLLMKAVPELAGLGLGPEVSACCFRGFRAEVCEVLWREGAPTDHVFVLGAGASIDLSCGCVVRDAYPGESFGVEALHGQHRWPHTATVKCEGEVWALDVAAVRELLATSRREDSFRQRASSLVSATPFKRLLPIQLVVLAAHAEVLQLQKGETLLSHGQRRAAFFVVIHGTLAVVEDGREAQRYAGAGQCIGERALVDMARGREIKVAATEPSSVLLLHEELLSAALGSELTLFLQRSVVRQVLHSFVSEEPRLAGAQPETLDLWAEKCCVQSVGPGEKLPEKALSGMLVVISGEITAVERLPDPTVTTASAVVEQFEVLGHEHLAERPADWLHSLRAGLAGTVVASLPWQYHEEVFGHCKRLSELVAYQKRLALVREIFIFRHLSERQRGTLVGSMSLVTKQRGEAVVREGEQGAEFYIIHKGDVHVAKNGNFITKLCQPAYFGERALLYEEPRAATVTVASESATFCVLTKSSFLEVLSGGALDFITYRNKLLDTDLQFSDLQMQKVIGRGGYGIVKLVRHKSSGTRYALKCVTREKLSDLDRSLVQRERAILQLLDHPFCLKLVRSFKDDNCVYFLTELVTGGELLDALDRLDVLNREQAQFYFGSLVLVFEYIHQKNVVYRDLKPENVLLDQDGFIKLIDFGAARRLDSPAQKCYTLLGTPYFMAPEMLLGGGYDMRADIWAMGVCLYEFVVGRLPFDAEDQETVFKRVASKQPAHIPNDLDRSSGQMLQWLLQKDPAERPEASGRGYKAIREHCLFDDFDFEALINRALEPPIVPLEEKYSEELGPLAETPQAEADSSCWRPAAAVVEVGDWDSEF